LDFPAPFLFLGKENAAMEEDLIKWLYPEEMEIPQELSF